MKNFVVVANGKYRTVDSAAGAMSIAWEFRMSNLENVRIANNRTGKTVAYRPHEAFDYSVFNNEEN